MSSGRGRGPAEVQVEGAALALHHGPDPAPERAERLPVHALRALEARHRRRQQAEAGAEDTAILSLSGVSISSASSTADMRKAYLKLSIKVHPDKNGNSPDSKAAFQPLVTAYEALSNPEAAAAEVGLTLQFTSNCVVIHLQLCYNSPLIALC